MTDMYLSKICIEKILCKNNIFYNHLFVSSEIRKTKRSGELYLHVIKSLNLDYKKIIHIGDSIKSDFLGARKQNIKAVLTPNKVNNLSFNYEKKVNNINDSILLSIANNNSNLKSDYYEKFGFERFGPFMVSYSKYIYQKLTEKNINRVFFLSRDGYIMKTFFDKLFFDKSIRTEYLEVSRRSLRVPVLWMNLKLENVMDKVCPSKQFNMISFFESVGLNIQEYSQELKKHGFTKDSVVSRETITKDVSFVEIYNDIVENIESVSKKEFEKLTKYLDQKKVSGKFAVVDIGWAGSMQHCITQTLNHLNIKHEITGIYTGVASYYKNNIKNFDLDMNGFVFDMKNNSESVDVRSGFVGLFESLFLENAGSVKNYFEQNGEIKAKRYEYEYEKDGYLTNDALIVNKIQSGAIKYLDFFSQNKAYINDLCPNNTIFDLIFKIGAHPTKRDLKFLGKLSFYDEGNNLNLINFKNHFHYLIKPKDLKKDFFLSRWKVAFLKKLFIIKINNYKIYSFLKRRFEKQ
jgi:predicted HAD superfamily hydrolase